MVLIASLVGPRSAAKLLTKDKVYCLLRNLDWATSAIGKQKKTREVTRRHEGALKRQEWIELGKSGDTRPRPAYIGKARRIAANVAKLPKLVRKVD